MSLSIPNHQLVAFVAAHPNSTLMEIELAERLGEAVREIDLLTVALREAPQPLVDAVAAPVSPQPVPASALSRIVGGFSWPTLSFA